LRYIGIENGAQSLLKQLESKEQQRKPSKLARVSDIIKGLINKE
jgi:hypothetical protein